MRNADAVTIDEARASYLSRRDILEPRGKKLADVLLIEHALAHTFVLNTSHFILR